MKLLVIFLLTFSTNSMAIKGEYTDQETPQDVCMISFTVPCEKDPGRNCKGACSSTYLGEGKLLTAGHCLSSLSEASQKSVICPNGESLDIEEQMINTHGSGMDNFQDLGIISVKGKFNLDGMPIVNGQEQFTELMKTPENCFLAGYGLDNENNWGELKVARSGEVETEKVINYGSLSYEREKISHRGNYADHGDSGGPYYCKKDGKNILMAVLQGGTEGVTYSLSEKLIQPYKWIQFHMSPLSDGTNELYKKLEFVFSFCNAVASCMQEIQSAATLGEDVSKVLQELSSTIKNSHLIPTIEGKTDRVQFKQELDRMIEEWRKLHSLCYDNK